MTPHLLQFPMKHRHCHGFVLISSMLILVILTLLSVSMARSFWFQEQMGGNAREKARAFSAAQAALQYAEIWLQKNASKTPVNCGTAAGEISIRICTDAPGDLSKVPLDTRTSIPLTYINVSSSGGLTSGDANFYANPGVHIRFLYSTPDGSVNFYRITAYGYGSNRSAMATTQSFFEVDFNTNTSGNKIKNIGGL